jgi:hypothetical protein
MPEQLRVLDLFSGIPSADSALDLKEPGCEPSPSAKSSPTAGQCFASIGLTCPSSRMCVTCAPSTSGQLTLFAGDTPASPSASPGSEQARRMTATSGQNLRGLCESYGRLGYLQRMLLGTSAWGSTKCFLTWKASATPAGRSLFQLVPLEPTTDATGSGLLPTLTARDFKSDTCSPEFRAKRDALKTGKTLPWTLRGLLNPTWCEWFMGFPVGHTALEPSAMPSSPKSRKLSGEPSSKPKGSSRND